MVIQRSGGDGDVVSGDFSAGECIEIESSGFAFTGLLKTKIEVSESFFHNLLFQEHDFSLRKFN